MKLAINLMHSLASGLSSKIICIIFIAAFVSSCEKPILNDLAHNDAKSIFNDTWTILDERYPFFTIKNLDWDAIYTSYIPRLDENLSEQQLFDLLGDLVLELHDGHTDLYAPSHEWTRSYWPITTEYYQRFNIGVIKNNYLAVGYYTQNAVVAGKIGDIGYVYVRDFVDDLSPALAEEVFNYLEGTQQYIFDVRNNTGGSEAFGNNLIRYFVKEKTANKIIKFKNGAGHDDFISATLYIEPGNRTLVYTSIVVLANKVTFSAGNDFVNTFSVLPNVTLIGDTTGGGGSTPYLYELANGWILRYSSNMQLRPGDNLILDGGIPPDIFIEMERSNINDNVLNAALDYLNQD